MKKDNQYMGCATIEKLQEFFAWGIITFEEYEAGQEFFESRENPS